MKALFFSEDNNKKRPTKQTCQTASHNMGQAKRISSKSMFMYLGELVEYGETETMFTNPVDERTKAYLTGKMGQIQPEYFADKEESL